MGKKKKKSTAKAKLKELEKLCGLNIPKTHAEVREYNRAKFMYALQKVGATSVKIQYDGSGDSGSVESVSMYNGETALDEKIGQSYISYYEVQGATNFGGGKSVDKVVRVTNKFDDALEEFAYDILSDKGSWGDNDGAYGTITFDVETKTIELDHNIRIMDTENEMDSWEAEELEEEEPICDGEGDAIPPPRVVTPQPSTLGDPAPGAAEPEKEETEEEVDTDKTIGILAA